MSGESESLFRVAESTLGDVKSVLRANDINFAEFDRGAWGVGVGTAWGDDIVIVVTVEFSGPEPPPVPYFYLTSGILRNARGNRQRLLEACNIFNERWVTPTVFVLDEDDGCVCPAQDVLACGAVRARAALHDERNQQASDPDPQVARSASIGWGRRRAIPRYRGGHGRRLLSGYG